MKLDHYLSFAENGDVVSHFLNADPDSSKKNPNEIATKAEKETCKMMKEALDKIVADKEKNGMDGCASQ
jgi:hypothetical protein